MNPRQDTVNEVSVSFDSLEVFPIDFVWIHQAQQQERQTVCMSVKMLLELGTHMEDAVSANPVRCNTESSNLEHLRSISGRFLSW